MEHTLRRQKMYFADAGAALDQAKREGAVTITRKLDNFYDARQPLQGNQPRRSKTIELCCNVTRDIDQTFWVLGAWHETYKLPVMQQPQPEG
jgi:hypothetical protein